jgi:hypothetical protein
MDERQERQEPHYALVGLYRQHGTPKRYFGSELKHQETIALRISRCRVIRDLHQEWYHPREELIEVVITPNQFAALLTTMNVGSGVPCTLSFLQGEGHIPGASEEEPPQAVYVEEFQQDCRQIARGMDDLIRTIEETPMTAKARKMLLDKAQGVRRHLGSNMPFVLSQFQEKMEHVVADGKAAIEAFVTGMVQRTGWEALRGKSPQLPELGAPEVERVAAALEERNDGR